MRIFAQSSMASQPIEASCSVLVVYADNGTPVAVFSTIGNNVAMRTAQSPGFGDTLRILGLKDKAPVVEVATGPEAPATQG